MHKISVPVYSMALCFTAPKDDEMLHGTTVLLDGRKKATRTLAQATGSDCRSLDLHGWVAQRPALRP